ncbi:MAG: hypothetical protein U5Q03_18010 [Bacteroidota bacterium]|nr:hypothetical protein [Bacteroidota bacterium]
MASMDYIKLDTETMQLITAEQAWHYSIIPKSNGRELFLFISAEKHRAAIKDELELLFGKTVILEQVQDQKIKTTLSRYYHTKRNPQPVAMRQLLKIITLMIFYMYYLMRRNPSTQVTFIL